MKDERGLVGRAAITIMVLIVVGGVALIDGGSILVAKLQISDTADTAAAAAAGMYARSHSVEAARDAAIEAAHERDPSSRVTSFTVTAAGKVTVTVVKPSERSRLSSIVLVLAWARPGSSVSFAAAAILVSASVLSCWTRLGSPPKASRIRSTRPRCSA